jgi:hypothetical protein
VGSASDKADVRIADDVADMEATAATWKRHSLLREMTGDEDIEILKLWVGALHREILRMAEEIDALRRASG